VCLDQDAVLDKWMMIKMRAIISSAVLEAPTARAEKTDKQQEDGKSAANDVAEWLTSGENGYVRPNEEAGVMDVAQQMGEHLLLEKLRNVYCW
jgi:hypothetical protein